MIWICAGVFLLLLPVLAFFWRLADEEQRLREGYRVVEHEETEWGMMFAIVAPDGKIAGYDRWKPAHERCAALNARLPRKSRS